MALISLLEAPEQSKHYAYYEGTQHLGMTQTKMIRDLYTGHDTVCCHSKLFLILGLYIDRSIELCLQY